MPEVDDTVYVARPDLLGLDGDEIDLSDLDAGLAEDAAASTAITILGGYYNPASLVTLCSRIPSRPAARRRDCRVRIAVGLEASSHLPHAWGEMLEVSERLRTKGFRNVEIRIIRRDPVHFHTKLFHFLKTTRPVWYVGSANPGSKRHEFMLRVTGRHDAMSGYAEAVMAKGLLVTEGPAPAVAIASLRDFFLNGVLCHKPPSQRLFTFDAFRFTPEHRETLALALAQGVGVQHASPRTEGFGFSLISALDMIEPPNEGETVEETARRIQYRPSCVDTVLGLWMPNAYADELRGRIREEEAIREQRLQAFSTVLDTAAGQSKATDAFQVHVASMTRFMGEHGIQANPVQNHEAAFKRFLAARTRTLASLEARVRHARTLTLAAMPDIWEDPRAVDEFETSFFEDLAYRTSLLAGNRSRVIRSLLAGLEEYEAPVDADEFHEVLSERLADTPWTNDEWITSVNT